MQQSRAPRRLFDDILAQLQLRQTELAIASCQALLTRYPDDINILGLLGAALGDLRHFDEAEEILNRVIDLAPTFAKPYEDLGTLLVQQHKAEQAVPLLEKAVRLDPQLDEAHFQLGKALALLGRGQEADASFERSFALSPERRLMALAAEHHKAGRLQDAEQLCRQVLQKNPRHVDALRMLGLIAAASGDLDDAEHLLRQALATAPDHTPALFELGRVLKELERPEDAIVVYRELLALQPDNPKAHYRLAGVLAPAALNNVYRQNNNHGGERMKRSTDVPKMLVLVFAARATSWQASARPIIDDKEWYQPADLLGYSWNDFNTICGGGAGNGLLAGAGPNLTGWTWASIDAVGDLFAATSPHPGGISTYQAYGAQLYANLITDTWFVRTTDDSLAINFGLTGIAGFTSTLLPGGGMAYVGPAQMGLGFPQGPPFASRFSTESTYPTKAFTEDEPYVGGWLYRAAEVPFPPPCGLSLWAW